MLLGPIRFTNALAGTPDFIYPGPAIDMQSPASAGAANGATYVYYAQSLDMSEWEIGSGAYTSGSGTFARTTVAANSLGTTAKINFTNPPQVLVVDSQSSLIQTLTAVRYDIAQGLTANQMAQARANIGVTKGNYIVNGGMMVSQENGSAAGTGSGYHAVDQTFMSFSNAGAFSFAQVASATPGGSPNRLRLTVTAADAAVGAGDILILQQRIEGYRVADLGFGGSSAKTITIQFGVKAPAGTYGVAVINNAFNRSYISEFTIAAGEANTDVVKSVTLPADTVGTWLKDSGIGLSVSWCLMAGSTFQQAAGSWGAGNCYGTSNQFNFAGTNGNVFELFDVGLYVGATAPAFQLPDYASELLLCGRYFQKFVHPLIGGWADIAGRVLWTTPRFIPEMRVSPTVTTIVAPSLVNSSVAVGATTPDYARFDVTAVAAGYAYAQSGVFGANARL